MSPPDRPRSMTFPPAPPPTSIEARVVSLEHTRGVHERDIDNLTHELEKQTEILGDIKNTLTVIGTERSNEAKSRETRMKVITGIAVGVSVAALGSLAGWVIHLQTAMAAVGK